jgi:hypothetical protein
MSKQAMRDETERLVKEALERKTFTVKQGKTRIDSKCGKCGALSSKTGSSAIHVQGMWRGTKDILMKVNARVHGKAHRHGFATASAV